MMKWSKIDSSDPGLKYLLFISFVFIFSISKNQNSFGQRSWTFNLNLGDVYCFNMPLIIEQDGYEKIRFTAHYRTNSFKLPVYYSWKIGSAKDKRGWELELIHMKIILTNNTPEIQHFEISHGFNYIFISRMWDVDFMMLRLGIGTILANPESIVRNMRFDTDQGILNKGYYVSGPGLQVAAEKKFPVAGGIFFDLEVKAAGALAKVKVAEGHAIVPQVGLHGLFGIGFTFD